jgi:hypothetical protein
MWEPNREPRGYKLREREGENISQFREENFMGICREKEERIDNAEWL